MKVACVWREGYDYSRTVADWISEFERRTGYEVENIDPGSREGSEFCRAYGIVRYPAILVLSDDGAAMQTWDGEMMPRFDEVGYFAGR